MEMEADQTQRAEQFSRDVLHALLKCKGFRDPKDPPKEAIEDARKIMIRFTSFFSKAFTNRADPKHTAKELWIRSIEDSQE
jgi:hypothetical protein